MYRMRVRNGGYVGVGNAKNGLRAEYAERRVTQQRRREEKRRTKTTGGRRQGGKRGKIEGGKEMMG